MPCCMHPHCTALYCPVLCRTSMHQRAFLASLGSAPHRPTCMHACSAVVCSSHALFRTVLPISYRTVPYCTELLGINQQVIGLTPQVSMRTRATALPLLLFFPMVYIFFLTHPSTLQVACGPADFDCDPPALHALSWQLRLEMGCELLLVSVLWGAATAAAQRMLLGPRQYTPTAAQQDDCGAVQWAGGTDAGQSKCDNKPVGMVGAAIVDERGLASGFQSLESGSTAAALVPAAQPRSSLASVSGAVSAAEAAVSGGVAAAAAEAAGAVASGTVSAAAAKAAGAVAAEKVAAAAAEASGAVSAAAVKASGAVAAEALAAEATVGAGAVAAAAVEAADAVGAAAPAVAGAVAALAPATPSGPPGLQPQIPQPRTINLRELVQAARHGASSSSGPRPSALYSRSSYAAVCVTAKVRAHTITHVLPAHVNG